MNDYQQNQYQKYQNKIPILFRPYGDETSYEEFISNLESGIKILDGKEIMQGCREELGMKRTYRSFEFKKYENLALIFDYVMKNGREVKFYRQDEGDDLGFCILPWNSYVANPVIFMAEYNEKSKNKYASDVILNKRKELSDKAEYVFSNMIKNNQIWSRKNILTDLEWTRDYLTENGCSR